MTPLNRYLIATYECAKGFTLKNPKNDRMFCSQSRWLGPKPRCQRIQGKIIKKKIPQLIKKMKAINVLCKFRKQFMWQHNAHLNRFLISSSEWPLRKKKWNEIKIYISWSVQSVKWPDLRFIKPTCEANTWGCQSVNLKRAFLNVLNKPLVSLSGMRFNLGSLSGRTNYIDDNKNPTAVKISDALLLWVNN